MYMAILNVALNLLSRNTFRKAAGDVKVLNTTLGDTGGVLDRLKGKMDLTHKMMGFASASVLVSNFASGVKSAVGAVENLVGKVGAFAEQGDRIAKTSRLVGLSVKDYQAFGAAAKHAGMSTEEMDSALKKFNVNLGKARSGDKNAFRAFDAILGGRSLSEFKDSTSLLKEIANGYTNLASAEQKAFVSQELFGRSGMKMTELLSGGGDKLQKLFDDYEALGGGFSEKGAKDAEAFDDALQDMRGSIESIKISVMQDLFPTFTDLFQTVQGFIKESGPQIKQQVGVIVGSVGNLVKSTLPYIPKVLGAVVKLVDTIGPGVLAIGAGFAGVLGVVLPIVPSLMAAASLISGPISAGVSLLVSLGGSLVTLGGTIGSIIAGPVLMGLKVVLGILTGPVVGTVALIATGIISWGIAIKSAVDNVHLWGDAWDFVVGSVKQKFNDFIDFVWSGIDSLPGRVKGALNGILSMIRGIPLLGKIFGSDLTFNATTDEVADSMSSESAVQTLGATAARSVTESRTTTTSRFAVDFKNMPRGVTVTPPDKGDFDWSRGYVLDGGF